VVSKQSVLGDETHLSDKVQDEALEYLCSILCFAVICGYHWQVAKDLCALPLVCRRTPTEWFTERTLVNQGKVLCSFLASINSSVIGVKSLC